MTEAHQIRLDPDPLEPYFLSQGFRVGDLVTVSGQAALDEHDNVVGAGDFDAQAEQVFRNLARVLEAGGSSLDRVVKVTIFLTGMGNFAKIVELRRRWFRSPYPTDTIVEVRALALPELEIEAVSAKLGFEHDEFAVTGNAAIPFAESAGGSGCGGWSSENLHGVDAISRSRQAAAVGAVLAQCGH